MDTGAADLIVSKHELFWKIHWRIFNAQSSKEREIIQITLSKHTADTRTLKWFYDMHVLPKLYGSTFTWS